MESSSKLQKDELHFWQAPLYWLYQALTRNDPIKPVDLIIVFAGRMERKRFGLELFRRGVAPRLLLSVGRFEVSRMGGVGFDSAAELIAKRDRTAPEERHFFVVLNAAGTYIETARLRRWNTYGEVLGLRKFLEHDVPRSVLVVSTDVHLHRIALVFNRLFREAPLEVHYCQVPASGSSVRKEDWWARPDDRQFVLKEAVKLAAYSIILSMPEHIVSRIMRLRQGDST